MGLIRAALGAGWAGRLVDFLEENPDTEADLQTLIQEIQVVLPAETVSASNHAVSANGAVSTDAAQGPGPEHPGALAARSELAYSMGQAGDPAAARDEFAALLPVAERVLGPEHPDTWHPRQPSLLDRAGRGRGRRATSSPRCWPYPSASSALSTPTP